MLGPHFLPPPYTVRHKPIYTLSSSGPAPLNPVVCWKKALRAFEKEGVEKRIKAPRMNRQKGWVSNEAEWVVRLEHRLSHRAMSGSIASYKMHGEPVASAPS